MTKKCCLPLCTNVQSKDICLFSLPSDEIRRKKWIAIIGGPDAYVNLQAEEQRAVNEEHVPLQIEEAVASTSFSIDRNIDAQQHHTVEMSSQTTPILSANTPRKARLHGEIKHLKQAIRRLDNKEPEDMDARNIVSEEEFIKFCERNFNEVTANLFKMQLELSKKKAHGHRYTDDFKQFALKALAS